MFLDDLLGRHDPSSEHGQETDPARPVTYVVDEAQYRTFEAFMRRRQP